MSESVQDQGTAGRTVYVRRVERVCANYGRSRADPASTPAVPRPINMGLDHWRDPRWGRPAEGPSVRGL
ncbi:hypothetical protein GCM10010415_34220 [Streptomyces atrovirens]